MIEKCCICKRRNAETYKGVPVCEYCLTADVNKIKAEASRLIDKSWKAKDLGLMIESNYSLDRATILIQMIKEYQQNG